MKKFLTGLLVSLSAIACCISFVACGDSQSSAKNVENQIETIKNVQFSDMWEIENLENVQKSYTALSDEEKANVSNYAVLQEKIEMLPYMKQYANLAVSTLKLFHKSLKDPSSLIIEADFPVYITLSKNYYEAESRYISDFSCEIKATYNSKNSFGGYVGTSVTYINRKKIYNDETINFFERSPNESILEGDPFFSIRKYENDTYYVRGKAVIAKTTVEEILAGKYDKFAN